MIQSNKYRKLTLEEWCEPVWCCANCRSLAVKYDPEMEADGWNGMWCSKCGSTNIVEIPFGQWLENEEKVKHELEGL